MNSTPPNVTGGTGTGSKRTDLAGKPQGKKNVATKSKPLSKKSLYSESGIVPAETIAGNALLVVIAIMAFLACLTLGIVSLVNQSASDWQNEISREVTIQIRPSDSLEMEKAIREVSKLALTYSGVVKVTELTDQASARLLEPWLGAGTQLGELPVPKLLIVSIDPDTKPDLDALSLAISEKIPGASLDDHRAWVDRLNAMSWVLVLIGFAIFFLVMAATVLTVVFATRGAMAGNKDVVEVLHFVGAESAFIAGEFQRHFLILGLKGALAGGLSAVFLFLAVFVWIAFRPATAESDQLSLLFGSFSLSWVGYLGIVVVMGGIAALTAFTSRLTVISHVNQLYSYRR